MDFRTTLGLKRESSVSPPGWEHSSEEDQPLDFSRQSPSAPKRQLIDSASSPAEKSPDSERDSGRSTEPDQRELLLSIPQPLRFHPMHTTTSPPQGLSPGFPPNPAALVGLSPSVLQANEAHLSLYGSLALKSLQANTTAQQPLFDPNYLLFRHQFLMQNKKTPTGQRRKTASSSPASSTSTPKTSDITEPSSELSDQSNDSNIHQSQADSTNRSPGQLPPMTPTSPAALPVTSSSSCSSRRRGKAFPDELKDEAYWERRRKNNEAAKRSRDARRAKEDEIAIRAAFLEQENLKLRVELGALNQQLIRLRALVEARQA